MPEKRDTQLIPKNQKQKKNKQQKNRLIALEKSMDSPSLTL